MDRTLRDLIRTVHVCRPIHVQAMKVQRRRLVSERVLDIDDELVALGDPDGWDGPLSVDANDGTGLHAIRVRIHPRYIKVVSNGGTVSQGHKQGYWKQKVGQRNGHCARPTSSTARAIASQGAGEGNMRKPLRAAVAGATAQAEGAAETDWGGAGAADAKD